MSMKSRMALLLPLLMMGGLGMPQSSLALTDEEKEELKQQRLEKENEIKLKNGLKPFNYDGTIIWAINATIADKKWRKLQNRPKQ